MGKLPTELASQNFWGTPPPETVRCGLDSAQRSEAVVYVCPALWAEFHLGAFTSHHAPS